MYQTILVPIDGSDPSRTALAHALHLADPLNATVIVLAVVEPARSPMAFGVDEIDEINQAIVDIVDAIVVNHGCPEVPIESEVRRGLVVFEVILDYAEEIRADCIVLGRCGTSLLPDAVFGSTADRVLRFADIPVILIPEPNSN